MVAKVLPKMLRTSVFFATQNLLYAFRVENLKFRV